MTNLCLARGILAAFLVVMIANSEMIQGTTDGTVNTLSKSPMVTCVDGSAHTIPYPYPDGSSAQCNNCTQAMAACMTHQGLTPGSWPTYCEQCRVRYITCADDTLHVMVAASDTLPQGCANCTLALQRCEGHGGLKPGAWPTYCDQCS